jgi:hypothetical protein
MCLNVTTTHTHTLQGLSTFEWLKGSQGLRRASWVHVASQTACVVAAAVFFQQGRVAAFMACVVGSRVGLYGFDVGFMELQQRQALYCPP